MQEPTTFFLTQGVLGVTCVVLGLVIAKLYNKIEKLQLRIEELQDMRLQDSKEVTTHVTGVLSDSSQNLRILSEKIEVARGVK